MDVGNALDGLAGLSELDAKALLAAEGHNELPRIEHRRLARIFIEVISEPMVFLLVGCGVVYFILGDRQEALMLQGFLVLILGITLHQERKTERALEALRDLSSPRALVLRSGQVVRIPGRDVVRGDLLILNEGDRVSADGNIMRCRNFCVDESMLTGESVPVEKNLLNPVNLGSRLETSFLVFAGTTVVRGMAVARVTQGWFASSWCGKGGPEKRQAS